MARYGKEFGGRGRSWRGWASEDVEFDEYGPGPRYEPGPFEHQHPRYGAERIRRARYGGPERGLGYEGSFYDFEFGGRGGYRGGGYGGYGGGFQGYGRGYTGRPHAPRGWGPNTEFYRGSSVDMRGGMRGRGGFGYGAEFGAGMGAGYGTEYGRGMGGGMARGYRGGAVGRDLGYRETGGREMGGRGRPQFHYGHTPTDRWPGDTPEEQTPPERGHFSDGEVRDAVRESLFHDSWVDPDSIEVDVDDGVVTLAGDVNDFMEARYAWDDAWETPGVRGVINNLTVRTDREQDEMELPQTKHGTKAASRTRGGTKSTAKATRSTKKS